MLFFSKKFFVLFIFSIIISSVKGQMNDSIIISDNAQVNISDTFVFDNNLKTSSFILPGVLLASGFAIRYIPEFNKLDKNMQHYSEKHIHWRTQIDDALFLMPVASVFVLDWCGIEARNNFKDRAIVTASSYAIDLSVLLLIRSLAKRERPDGSGNDSFPSGHASSAFVGAHLLMKEYRDKSLWIGISGYALAASVSFLRVSDNHHWLSDVITGAGLGILSVELGYLLLPYLSKTFTFGEKKTDTHLSVAPVISSSSTGFGFSYTF